MRCNLPVSSSGMSRFTRPVASELRPLTRNSREVTTRLSRWPRTKRFLHARGTNLELRCPSNAFLLVNDKSHPMQVYCTVVGSALIPLAGPRSAGLRRTAGIHVACASLKLIGSINTIFSISALFLHCNYRVTDTSPGLKRYEPTCIENVCCCSPLACIG